MPDSPILIVDDEEYIIKTITRILNSGGYTNILSCRDGRKVMPLLDETPAELLLLDLTMPHMSGFTLLEKIHEEHPDIPVVIVTGTDEIDTAVTCMKSGAVDYFVKPVEENRLLGSIRKILDNKELKRTVSVLKRQFLRGKIQNPEIFSSIITRNSEMKNIFIYLETIAATKEPVLITGETGTGKELIAEAVHRASGRSGPFVTLNIAGLDDTMFSDTLFGHRKGAYTGAAETRRGMIEQAAKGTLFLDEIGDVTPASQIKLLRLLESGEYYPLGSDIPKRADTRIVLATNHDTEELVKQEKMRKDFYYRISTHSISIPPLRNRLNDIPLLVKYFVKSAAKEYGKAAPHIPEQAYSVLRPYKFPGNIRELRSMIYDAVGRSDGSVLNMELFSSFAGGSEDGHNGEELESFQEQLSFPEILPTLKEMSSLLIREALRRAGGNQAKAAGMLGITPQALSKRLKHQQ